MSGFEIYFLSLIGNLQDLMMILGILCVFLFVGAGFYTMDQYDDEDKAKGKSYCKKAVIGAFIAFTLACFIPSKKTIIAMYVVPAISEYKVTKELPDNLQKVIDKFVKNYLEEK